MNPLTSATGLGPRTSFRQRPSAAVRVVSPVSIAIDVPGRKGLSLQQMASTLALDERGRLACSRCHVGRMHEACCESNAARKCRRRGKMHSAGLEWHSGCRRLLRGNGARRPTRRGRIRPHGRSRHKIRSAGNKDSTSNRRRSARRLERSQRTTASSWASVRALRRRKSSTRIAARHAGYDVLGDPGRRREYDRSRGGGRKVRVAVGGLPRSRRPPVEPLEQGPVTRGPDISPTRSFQTFHPSFEDIFERLWGNVTGRSRPKRERPE